MNNTKKWLLIFATIFMLAGIGYDIFYVVTFFQTPAAYRPALFYVIYEIIAIVFLLTATILLIYTLWGNGKHFRERYRYFVTSLIISICLNLFSVSTILMIFSIYFNDSVFVFPDKKQAKPQDKNVVDVSPEGTPSEKEMKIQALRKMKEEGKISEQEFQEELLKLL